MKALEREAKTLPWRRLVNVLGNATLSTLSVTVLVLGELYFVGQTALRRKINPRRNQQ